MNGQACLDKGLSSSNAASGGPGCRGGGACEGPAEASGVPRHPLQPAQSPGPAGYIGTAFGGTEAAVSPLSVTKTVRVNQTQGCGEDSGKDACGALRAWGPFPGSCGTHFISGAVLLLLDPKGLGSKSRAAFWQTH